MTETETVEVPWNSKRIYTVDHQFMVYDKSKNKWVVEDDICTSQVGVELDLPDADYEEWGNEWISFDQTILEYFDNWQEFQACWDKTSGIEDGHTIKIVNVYMTKEQLFTHYAPCMNFEYDYDQLVEVALKRGFVTETDNGYKINNNY